MLLACKRARNAPAGYQPFSDCESFGLFAEWFNLSLF